MESTNVPYERIRLDNDIIVDLYAVNFGSGSHTEAIAWADYGGWHWRAGGQDREQAARRLQDRLDSRNPFDGLDTDWGLPGWRNLPEVLSDDLFHLDDRIEEWGGAESEIHALILRFMHGPIGE